jgi:hypothetical protein
MYFLLAPLIFLSLHKSINRIVLSSRAKNYSKLKADVFFFALILLVIVYLIFVIESMD